MYDFLKKGILLGVGLATVTREKLESTVEELIKKGELSEPEGTDLIELMKSKSEEVRAEIASRVDKVVADRLEKLKIPRKEELEELRKRIEKLEESAGGE